MLYHSTILLLLALQAAAQPLCRAETNGNSASAAEYIPVVNQNPTGPYDGHFNQPTTFTTTSTTSSSSSAAAADLSPYTAPAATTSAAATNLNTSTTASTTSSTTSTGTIVVTVNPANPSPSTITTTSATAYPPATTGTSTISHADGCICTTGASCSLPPSCAVLPPTAASTLQTLTTPARATSDGPITRTTTEPTAPLTTASTSQPSSTPTATIGPQPKPNGNNAGVALAGVNFSGLEWGTGIDGGTPVPYYVPPNVIPQFPHFKSVGANIFRIPAGWTYLVNGQLSGPLDMIYVAQYDTWVNACLATGAKCIIELHNYARFQGQIIGQSAGAVKDEDLMDVWVKLASRYRDPNVIYEIINEPHDIDTGVWKNTVQKVVTAIRSTGQTENLILLPGNSWTSALNWQANSGNLLDVVDSDGTKERLIIDVHKYLDGDGSGTSTTCVGNSIDAAFQPLAKLLRANGRQALLTETGGGNTDSCLKYVCQELDFLNKNSDVFLGWLGWSAGGFASSYELNEVPGLDGTDQPMVQQCVLGQFEGSSYYAGAPHHW